MSFRFLTAGESHGQALVGVLEGVPAGLRLTADDFAHEMPRRKLGYGRGFRQKIEDDQVRILTGVRHGRTLGSPISLMIENRDWTAWKQIMQAEEISDAEREAVRRQVSVPRPGHADLVGGMKYDHEDLRNVLERASARETAMRVALGTVARRFIAALGIRVGSRVVSIGEITDSTEAPADLAAMTAQADASPTRSLGQDADAKMTARIEKAKKDGDTLGGVIEVLADGLPIGIGSYVQWDRRLEGAIGKAFLSLNAIKGVEVGLGFEAARLPGSQAHDEMRPAGEKRVGYLSNRSGGIDGGMSTGQRMVVRAAMKPLATLMKPLASVDVTTGEAASAHVERSDVCAVPAAAVIGESLLALVLAEAMLEKFGGDSMPEILKRVEDWNVQHAAR